MGIEAKMTTLCYIEKDGAYLMLHRVSKKHDVCKDKWIGVGGHFEISESPEECLLRDVKEETGLTLTSWRFIGLVTFVAEGWDTEYMLSLIHIYTNVKYFYFVWTVAVLLCLLSMRIAHSKWGREFKAVKDNAEAIESLGLDIKKIKIRAFTLAAVYGALGGALYAHFNQFVTSLSFTTDLSISCLLYTS